MSTIYHFYVVYFIKCGSHCNVLSVISVPYAIYTIGLSSNFFFEANHITYFIDGLFTAIIIIIITYMMRCEHIRPVLQKLHWLSVKRRIVYTILVLTYKVLYGISAPTYMLECLTQYRPSRNLCSASLPLQLQVPST